MEEIKDMKKTIETKKKLKKNPKKIRATSEGKNNSSTSKKKSLKINLENENPNCGQPKDNARIETDKLTKDTHEDTESNHTDQHEPAINLKETNIPKIPAPVSGIRWEENLVCDKSLLSSPSHRLAPATKSVLKKTQRDSGLFNVNMLSVLENLPAETTYGKRNKGKKCAKKKKHLYFYEL